MMESIKKLNLHLVEIENPWLDKYDNNEYTVDTETLKLTLRNRTLLRYRGVVDYIFMELELIGSTSIHQYIESINSAISEFYLIKDVYKENHSDKDTQIILLVDNYFTVLYKEVVKELVNVQTYFQLMITDSAYITHLVEKILNNEKLDKREIFQMLCIDKRNQMEGRHTSIIDLNKVDKYYNITYSELKYTLDHNYELFTSILEVFGIEYNDCGFNEDDYNKETVYLKYSPFNDKKTAYSILVALTTLLNNDYYEVIIDFNISDDTMASISKLLHLINKDICVYSCYKEFDLYLSYKLNKLI